MSRPSQNPPLSSGLHWRGLTPQLFLFIVLPLTVLVVAIPFGSLILHGRAMRVLVGERDERAARAAATAMTEQLSHRAAAIRGLALRAADADSTDHTQVLTDYAFLWPDFEGGLALFAPSGTLIASSNESDLWQNRPVADLLNHPNPQEDAQFSATFSDPTNDEPLVLVAATTANGPVAVGAFSPASLAYRALGEGFTPNDQSFIWLVDDQYKLLYQMGALPSEPDVTHHPGIAEALSGASGAIYLPVDGDEHVVAFSPVTPDGF